MVKGRTIKLVGIYRWRHINDDGVIATFQSFPTFGRVYAAYGGVFIVMSLIWAYIVDKQAPDKYDLIGACICIIGVCVMILPSRT